MERIDSRVEGAGSLVRAKSLNVVVAIQLALIVDTFLMFTYTLLPARFLQAKFGHAMFWHVPLNPEPEQTYD